MTIEMMEDFKLAFHKMENTNGNLFITGKAVTGKSTLLKYFRENTVKKAAVLTAAGTAAPNAAGQTVHSFSGIMNKTPVKVSYDNKYFLQTS